MSTHVIAVTDRLVTVRTLYATKDGRTVKDVRYAARFDAATAERIAAALRERRGALKPGGWRHLGDSNGRGRTYGPGDAATIRAVAVSEIATAGAHPKLTPDECAALYSRANAAGMLAGEAATPTPMTVVERANPIDDRSSVQRAWIVADGACGFAWVNRQPGNVAIRAVADDKSTRTRRLWWWR